MENQITPESEEFVTADKIIISNIILLTIVNFFLPGTGHYLIGQTKKGKAMILISVLVRSLAIIPIVSFFWIPFMLYHMKQGLDDLREILKRLQNGEKVQHGECTNETVCYGISSFIVPYKIIMKEGKKE